MALLKTALELKLILKCYSHLNVLHFASGELLEDVEVQFFMRASVTLTMVIPFLLMLFKVIQFI